MRNFTIILFIFLILTLLGWLFVADPLLFFITIFLGFLISFVSLFYYLGALRGVIIGLTFIILPFLIEYFGFRYNIPFFSTHLIKNLSFEKISVPFTLATLFTLFTIPLLFITSLFFAYKIKNYFGIKNLHKTFLICVSSILIALNFLVISNHRIYYNDFLKWLAIGIIANLLLCKLFRFNPKVSETFKEIPIILFLSIFGSRALITLDSLNLVLSLVLTVLYLLTLYNEYKLRKISTDIRTLGKF